VLDDVDIVLHRAAFDDHLLAVALGDLHELDDALDLRGEGGDDDAARSIERRWQSMFFKDVASEGEKPASRCRSSPW
jgi:hypothetical protein